jgi:uncharacterized membrane protein YkvA (DUF1232 family)
VIAVYLASRDPRVPWYAKALALLVAGYALSPIDLIPDFIPVLGYLDDMVLVPLGIIAVVKLGPARHHGRSPGRRGAHFRKAGEPHGRDHRHPDLGSFGRRGRAVGHRCFAR